MFPNHASSSSSNAWSVTKSFASGRSFARSFLPVGLDFSGCEPGRAIGDASCPANELKPAAIALFDLGSTFTLYGGSVLTSWISAPSSSRSNASVLLESPHNNRWSPRTHRSPDWVVASSGGWGTSSGSHCPSCSSGFRSWPSRPRSNPSSPKSNSRSCSAASSIGSSSKSHSASSAV